jgi:hypothetical protein
MDENLRALIVVPKRPSNPWWGLLKTMTITSIELRKSNEVHVRSPLMCSNTTEKMLPPGLFLMILVDLVTSKVVVH